MPGGGGAGVYIGAGGDPEATDVEGANSRYNATILTGGLVGILAILMDMMVFFAITLAEAQQVRVAAAPESPVINIPSPAVMSS